MSSTTWAAEPLALVVYINRHDSYTPTLKVRCIMPERFLGIVERIERLISLDDSEYYELKVGETFTLETERETEILDTFGGIGKKVFSEEDIPNNTDLTQFLWKTISRSTHRRAVYRDIVQRLKSEPTSLSQFTEEEFKNILKYKRKTIEKKVWEIIFLKFGLSYATHCLLL